MLNISLKTLGEISDFENILHRINYEISYMNESRNLYVNNRLTQQKYRIVLNTMSHYIHIMRTETRIIQEVVLYLRSHYIPSPISIPLIFNFFDRFLAANSKFRALVYLLHMYVSKTGLFSVGLFYFRGQNILSHYIRGRTILKVALYEKFEAIFSHYIRGRIVL